MDSGTGTSRIEGVAHAQLAALAGLTLTTASGEHLTFVAAGEFPLFSEQSGDQTYRYLGTIYNVTVDSGG